MSLIDPAKFGEMIAKVEMLAEAITRERHDNNVKWDAYIQANNQRHEENEELNMLRHEKVDARVSSLEKEKDKYFNRVIGGFCILIPLLMVWAVGPKATLLWVLEKIGG